MRELAERLRRFSLELHPDKTRLIEFGRFAAENRKKRGLGKPETFDFLGFTHISGQDRRGWFQVKRRTSRKRMTAKLKEIRSELLRRRHQPVPEVGRWLGRVVRGYLQYHAIPTNSQRLKQFLRGVRRAWMHALRRRSQKHRTSWERLDRLTNRWLPRPAIIHPWPKDRFNARPRGRSPVR